MARLAGCGPEPDRSLAQAEEGVARLHASIDQLLLLSRLEGPFSFEDGELLDAGSIAHEVVHRVPAEQSYRVVIADEGGAPAVPKVPSSLTMTAVRNILDNALRHGGEDAPVTLRLHATPDTVSFVVEDQGAGMDARDLVRAAERFWRKGRGPGSGLGLSIVDAIVARYGGSWELLPRAAGGLAARVSFPAA